MILLKAFFEKVNLTKNQQTRKKHEIFPSMHRVKLNRLGSFIEHNLKLTSLLHLEAPAYNGNLMSHSLFTTVELGQWTTKLSAYALKTRLFPYYLRRFCNIYHSIGFVKKTQHKYLNDTMMNGINALFTGNSDIFAFLRNK